MLVNQISPGEHVYHLPESVFAGMRPVRLGQLGYESYYKDPLADWVANEARKLAGKPQDFLAVDIGGGTGYRAADLVKKAGFDVLVIDCEGEPEWIKTRNEILARETKSGRKIDLLHSKIQDIDAPRLTRYLSEKYESRQPSVFTAYNIIHFLDSKDLVGLFKTVSQVATADCVFALSYRQGRGRWNIHNPEDVTQTANTWGFEKEIEIYDTDKQGVSQSFRLKHPVKSLDF